MASSAARHAGSKLRLLKYQADLPASFLAILSSASASSGTAAAPAAAPSAAIHSASTPGSVAANASSLLKQHRQHASTFAVSSGLRYHVPWDYRGQRQIVPLHGHVPDVAVDAFVAPNVVLVGFVEIQDRASVWYGSVLRGDLNKIFLGFLSNVGDRCVIHAAESSPTGFSAATSIGRMCTIGPYCSIRSCTVENEAVVGQSCVLMEGSLIEKHAYLADGSVLPPGRRIPSGELWAGNPARYVRDLGADEIAAIPKLAEAIHDVADDHAAQFLPYSTAYLEAEKLGLISPVEMPE